jgi:hypothetical protein
VTVAVCVMDPDPEMPVTVAVYAPGVVVAVEPMVTTSVPEPPVTVPDAGVQVAGLVAPLGPVTAQVILTAAVNGPIGATVIVEVLPVVAPAAIVRLAGFAMRPKLAAVDDPLTTASTAVVCT